MNVKNWPLILFVLGSIFQWYILSGWISRSEQVISKGIYAKIPCRQVDPIDPFRGAYLTVNPDPAVFEFDDSLQYMQGQEIWVNYSCYTDDVCSYYSIQQIDQSPEMPVHLRCKISSVYPYRKDDASHSSFTGTIEYPISRFYFNEKLSDDITDRYNKALRDTAQKVLAGIYVTEDGRAILEGIWLGDTRLTQAQ